MYPSLWYNGEEVVVVARGEQSARSVCCFFNSSRAPLSSWCNDYAEKERVLKAF